MEHYIDIMKEILGRITKEVYINRALISKREFEDIVSIFSVVFPNITFI